MPDQRGCNGKLPCQPSQPPHEYGPGIRPKDATDKEARTPRSRGRSVVVLYNDIRTHRSLDKMHRSLARFSGPEASNRSPSSADSITAMPGFKFSVHTGVCMFISGTLGTVIGNFCSHNMGLDDAGTSILLSPIVAVLFLAGCGGRLLLLPFYWLTVVLIRAAGTAVGDSSLDATCSACP